MKDFKLINPKTIDAASVLLRETSASAFAFAGGTDILGLLKNENIEAEALVNLKSLPSLNKIEYTPGKGFIIGSLVKIAEIQKNQAIRKYIPALSEAAKEIGSPQIRNMGTAGGNLCQRPRCWYFRGDYNCIRKGGDTCFALDGENKFHCITGGDTCFIVHPSDLAVALLALDARVKIYQDEEEKVIPVADFFLLPEENDQKENILQSGDLLLEIQIPEQAKHSRSTYLKIKERGSWDFAIVSAALVINQSNNRITDGKVAFGGVAPSPWVDQATQNKMNGLELKEKEIRHFADGLFSNAGPLSKNGYKVEMARNLFTRGLLMLSGA